MEAMEAMEGGAIEKREKRKPCLNTLLPVFLLFPIFAVCPFCVVDFSGKQMIPIEVDCWTGRLLKERYTER